MTVEIEYVYPVFYGTIKVRKGGTIKGFFTNATVEAFQSPVAGDHSLTAHMVDLNELRTAPFVRFADGIATFTLLKSDVIYSKFISAFNEEGEYALWEGPDGRFVANDGQANLYQKHLENKAKNK